MYWRQFKFVVKKNLLVKSRHLTDLLLEFLVPLLVIIGLWSIRLAINKKVTEEYLPDYSLNVDTLDDMYHSPRCRQETLLWNCVTLENTDCDVYDSEINSWEGCMLKKIAVAPADASDVGQAQAARDFIAFANSSLTSHPLNSQGNVSIFTYFESESDFISHIRQKDYSLRTQDIQSYSSAVIFRSAAPAWDYTVRLNKTTGIVWDGSEDANAFPSTEDTTNILLKSAWDWPEGDDVFDVMPYVEGYYTSGLFTLTNYINSFISTETCRSAGHCTDTENVDVFNVGLVHFPNIKIEEDSFWASLGPSFALLMILALLYPISNVIKSLVSEKESRLKEGMLMMSLESSVLAASWIFHFFLIFCPLAVILMLAGQGLFQYSENVFIFLYFMCFFMSSLAFSFLVSTLFSRAKSASILGTFAYFMGYFIYIGLESSSGLSRNDLMLACLHPASAFTFGTLAFMEYEDAQIGITSSTWTTSNEFEISFADTLLMQFINTLYLGFLAWYLSQVWRTEFGLARPWYFIFMPSYWKSVFSPFYTTSRGPCRGARVDSEENESGEVEMATVPGTATLNSVDPAVPVEDVTSNMKQQVLDNECVHISGLKKVFNTNTGKKVAVDGLDMTFYTGQITALLGHNGAGKSTVVSMLSGLYPPDDGTATIAGYDISTDMHEARKLLGVCPQHDVLLPDLTVAEHLEFFAGIKGCPAEEIAGEVDRLIKSVGLAEKRNVRAKLLSGGQKRKLSVAIAFIGDSKIVILDEPTSGMDPYSRRFTWNVIRQHREGRVIILVTHFMDEADLLGDRIAIMGDGKLLCCGSSLFLKKKYGVGYNMTVEKKSATHFDTAAVLNKIHETVPDATILTDVGTELTVQLPFASSQNFEHLFSTIDDSQEELEVSSYGMTVTTMEEVFLKVAAGTDTISQQKQGVSSGRDTDAGELLVSNDDSDKEGVVVAPQESSACLGTEEIDEEKASNHISPGKEEGSMFSRHMYTLLQKRYLYFSRDTKSWVYQYLLPVLFVLIGAIIMSITEFVSNQGSLVVSHDMFNTKLSSNVFPLPYGSDVCYSEDYCAPDDPTRADPYLASLSLMENVPDATNLPVEWVNATNLVDISRFLLDRRSDFAASRYGAISFHEILTNKSSINNGTISEVKYSIHGNFSGVHSTPVTNHLVAQAVARSFDTDTSITMRLHPLPETVKQDNMFSQWSITNLVIFVALAISFVPAGMASFVVYEKETKSRHQQLVSGVSIQSYWLSTWIWDSLSYQITAWLMLIVIISFKDTEPLTSPENLPYTAGLLMLYGPAVAGSVYLFSYALKTSASSQIVVIFAMFVQGLIFGIIGLVLRIIVSTRDIYLNVIRYCLVIFPPFAVIEGLNNLAVREQHSSTELGGGRMYSPGDMKITGLNLIVLGAEAALLILVQILLDYLLLKPQLLDQILPKKVPPPPGEGRDDDVEEEDRLVADGTINENNSTVLLKDMTKVYSGGKYAVKGVSLGIPMGQCFGLLGVNGAGKSSLLNMLSGEFAPTSGDAFISGLSLSTDVDRCRKLIGFCPQFDALYDLLTGREHLTFYAAIKGVKREIIDEVVNVKLKEMGLIEYADRAAGGYSGGNKRKLSVAMAMIGDPTIVFLDEPSTGMDPMARRFMWRVISDVVTKREQCSLILTTHSMEECEALCTRISIMVDGVMRCLGSSQRLRNKYGLGYQIEILLKVPDDKTVAEMSVDLISLLDTRKGGVDVSGELTRGEAEAVMKAIASSNSTELKTAAELRPVAEWVDRFCEHGSGADIHSSFLHSGFVTVAHLASWCILERRYESLLTFMGNHFEGFQVRERQIAKVRVEVPLLLPSGEPRRLSRMFGLVEESVGALQIMEYSISQTSLEQIFNSFAMKQSGETL